MENKALLFLIILISVGLGSLGQVFMKLGVNAYGEVNISSKEFKRLFLMMFQPFVMLGLSFYAFSSVLWLVALSKADLSFVYPMIGIGFILSSFFGRFIFKESFTFMKVFGILSIILGVVMVGFGTPKN